MRILHVADFHYTLRQWDWLVRVVAAERFDLVVNAGDLLDIASLVDKEVQIAVTLKYVATLAAKAPLAICSGNHDANARDAGTGEPVARWLRRAWREGARIDGESFALGGAYFTILPWWDGPRSRAAVGTELEREALRLDGRQWIWITHAPPQGSRASWTGRTHFGDVAVAEWIGSFRPAMLLGGHVHQAPFARGGSWIDRVGDTWVMNPGRQIGPVPAHIVVDSGLDTADWFSLAGHQHADLGAVPFLGAVDA